MINWISNWSQGIVVSVIVGTIIEMVLPEGNCKKYVKVIIGIYILISIISPITAKFTGKTIKVSDIIDLDEYIESVENSNVNLRDSLELNNASNIKEMYINGLKSDIKNKLYDKGYNILNLSIDIEDSDEYKIRSMEIKVEKVKESENQNESLNFSIENNEINIGEIEIGKQENGSINTDEVIIKEEIKSIKEYLSTVYDVDEKRITIN